MSQRKGGPPLDRGVWGLLPAPAPRPQKPHIYRHSRRATFHSVNEDAEYLQLTITDADPTDPDEWDAQINWGDAADLHAPLAGAPEDVDYCDVCQ